MQPTVPFADLGRCVRQEQGDILAAIERVLDSGHYIGGQEVKQFETEWAQFCHAKHCVAVANGTDAIKIALRCVAKRGADVLTVANSAPATVTAIVESGMVPIFCDIGRDGLMDLERALAIGHALKPAVLLPVHLYGRVMRLSALQEVARHIGAVVVEDACQAHGACDEDGRRPGELSGVACWSFYPTKNLGALGDAGAITFGDMRQTERTIAMRLRGYAVRAAHLTNYGLRDRARLSEPGYNSRMDPIQAAILRYRIPRLLGYIAHRYEISDVYAARLHEVGISLIQGGNRHIVAIRARQRAALMRHLEDCGITTHVHYQIPVHRQPCFREFTARLSLPETEAWCREILSLPMHNAITRQEVIRVCDAIREFSRSRT